MRGVIFDFFGTLMIYTNSRKAWEDWLSSLYENFKRFGYTKPKSTFAVECDGIMNKPEPNYKSMNLTVFEKRIYALSIELGLEVKPEEIRSVSQEAMNVWQRYVPLDPNAIPVLEVLKRNNIVALISNFDHPPHIYSLLTKLKLDHFFDSIIISSEVGVKKPNPAIFSFALKETNLKPSEVCYIGDTKDDITAAIRADIRPILIQREIDGGDELLYDYSVSKSLVDKKVLNNETKNVKVITSLKELIDSV
ncbi:MAG: HAD family hydrolase [Promethearchaeota archaeon]